MKANQVGGYLTMNN